LKNQFIKYINKFKHTSHENKIHQFIILIPNDTKKRFSDDVPSNFIKVSFSRVVTETTPVTVTCGGD